MEGEVVTVNGDRYQAMLNEFLFTNIEQEDNGNICILFLKIALSATDLISFGHLGAAIDTVGDICEIPSKKIVTPTCQR